MQKNEVIFSVKDNKKWHRCPRCNQNILKYNENTKSKKIYIM